MVHVESISNGLWGKLRKRLKVGKETNKAILKPGDTIRVIGSRGTAKIRAILISVHGALLEKQIDGFRLWNLDELRTPLQRAA
jgi:hypothetical protein